MGLPFPAPSGLPGSSSADNPAPGQSGHAIRVNPVSANRDSASPASDLQAPSAARSGPGLAALTAPRSAATGTRGSQHLWDSPRTIFAPRSRGSDDRQSGVGHAVCARRSRTPPSWGGMDDLFDVFSISTGTSPGRHLIQKLVKTWHRQFHPDTCFHVLHRACGDFARRSPRLGFYPCSS